MWDYLQAANTSICSRAKGTLGSSKVTLILRDGEKESVMNQHKFAQMVREFPFLTRILTEQNLSADSIGSIEVMRGDRNLLEVEPRAWAHDADQYG